MKSKSILKGTYNELLTSLLLTSNIFCLYIPFSGVFVVVTGLLMIMYFAGGNGLLPRNIVPVIVFCFFWFFYSVIFQGFNNEYMFTYFLNFLVMGISGLFISQLDVKPRVVVLYMCAISVFVYPVFLRQSGLNLEPGEYMGLSYTSLRLIIPLICSYYFVKKKFYFFLLLPLLLIYLFTFLSFASRGAILSIGFFIFLALFVSVKKYRVVLFLIIGFLVVFIYSNFIEVITWLDDTFENNGVHVYALHKIVRFASVSEGLDNGRGEIINLGLSQFYDSPIFGNGIAYFELGKTGYVHNIFVQMLLEGGVIMTLPFILLLLYTTIVYMKGETSKENLLYIALLLSCCFVLLLFSDTFWRIQHFWYFVGYMIKFKADHKQYGKFQYYNTPKGISSYNSTTLRQHSVTS